MPRVWKRTNDQTSGLQTMERGNRSHNQALKQCNQLKMTDISSRMNVILGTSSLQQLHAVKEAELL
jgi:hypothetical protein